MIMALGNFSVSKVISAAVAMSKGETSRCITPTKRHPNGWGMIWNKSNHHATHKLSHFRCEKAIENSINLAPLDQITGNFLAVHVRHATLAHCIGIEYAHPITNNQTQIPWYLMHNGFLPTIYKKLELDQSFFDSQEYFNYIIPHSSDRLHKNDVIKKLNELEMGGTSANAIVANSKHAYVIHWSMPNVEYPHYFTLYKGQNDDAIYIASEIQPTLVPDLQWAPLKSSSMYEYDITVGEPVEA